MRPKKHLSQDERITIQTMLDNSAKPYEIAQTLNKSPSTIIREIRNHTKINDCRKWSLAENEGSVFVHTVIRSARNVTNETVGRSVVIMKRMNVPYKMRRLMYVMDVIGSSTVEWRSAYTKV